MKFLKLLKEKSKLLNECIIFELKTDYLTNIS